MLTEGGGYKSRNLADVICERSLYIGGLAPGNTNAIFWRFVFCRAMLANQEIARIVRSTLKGCMGIVENVAGRKVNRV